LQVSEGEDKLTEAWKRRKMQKAERTKKWRYTCIATQWWGDEVESASFPYTPAGKAKKIAWTDEHEEADWKVTSRIVKGDR